MVLTDGREEELVYSIKQKDKRAYQYLYDQYAPALYTAIKRIVTDEYLSQDILQDTFLKVYSHIGYYDSAKGRLGAWMLSIARNIAIDKLRTASRKQQAYQNSSTTASIQISTDQIDLSRTLLQLKDIQRQIVHLAYYRGYKVREIADILNIPQGTVKTHMRAAISALRKCYCICQ